MTQFAYQTADYLSLPRLSNPFLVQDLLPVGGSLLLYGEPKVGKSYAALQLANALATGTDWLGFQTRQSTVLYVQLDTPRTLWVDRLDKLGESGGIDLTAPIIHADRESLNTWPFDILVPEHFDLLRSIVTESRADVVIIDTLKESHQISENDNTEGQKVIAALVRATQPAGLILVHHARKPSQDRPNDTINGARGASYLTGRMDGIIACHPRSFSYIGRATEGGTIRLERLDNGLWAPAEENKQVTEWAAELLADESLSMRERARRLANLSNRTEEQARSLLRRLGQGT